MYAGDCLASAEDHDASSSSVQLMLNGRVADRTRAHLVGQFLPLLDGFTRFDDVFSATTNLPGALDDALMRPGRLGQKLQFTTPSEHDRVRILDSGKHGVPFTSSPNLAAIAKKTEGWSAADLTAIWTEAGIAAAIDGRLSIADDDIDIGVEAVDRDRTHEWKAS